MDPTALTALTEQDLGKTKLWSKLRKGLQFESAVDVTLGSSASIVGGLPWGSTGEIITGGTMSLVVDPMEWLADGDTQDALQYALPTGEWSGLFGNGRTLHYGKATSIHHGREFVVRGKQVYDGSNLRTGFFSAISAASFALPLLGFVLQKKDATKWDTLTRMLGPRGVSGMLLHTLLMIEAANAELDTGDEELQSAASLANAAGSLALANQAQLNAVAATVNAQAAALSGSGAEDLAAAQAEQDSEDASVDDAESDAEADPDSEVDMAEGSDDAASEEADTEPPEEPSADEFTLETSEADSYQCLDGLLSTSARHVTFRARARDDDDTDPSLIHLDAEGADGEDNGVIALNSTGQATVVCGPASVQVRRDGDTGQIDIDTGDEGQITLATGGTTGSKAVLDPETITLSVGAEGAGALITMTSDGIKLSVGPEGGPCLELTTSGVTMSCGANSVAVDQAGQSTSAMNVSQEAQMNFEAKGLMATVEGSAMTTVKGGITMIN